MLNFVKPKLDALRGGHLRRDVAADTQASLVRLVDNRWHKFRLYRTVNFDLNVAQLRVVVDGGARFWLGGDEHLGRPLKRPSPINDAGNQNAGTDLFSIFNALAARQ